MKKKHNKKGKKLLNILLIVIGIIGLLIIIKYPCYLSIQHREWVNNEFYEVSKRLIQSHQGIKLSQIYEAKNGHEFRRLYQIHGTKGAKEIYTEILVAVFTEEANDSIEGIDTVRIFENIRKSVNNKIWLMFSVREPEKILYDHINELRQLSYDDLLKRLWKTTTHKIKGESKDSHTIETRIYWDRMPNKNLRVRVSLSGSTIPKQIDPMVESFVIAPNDSFIGE